LFSPANLRRDAHLRGLLSQSPGGGAPLTSLLRFHRLAALAGSGGARALAAAAASVPSIELVRSGAAAAAAADAADAAAAVSALRPAASLAAIDGESAAADARTLYVDGLPRNVTHESLATAFSAAYGAAVAAVRLPRHAHSRAQKGFAFVEMARDEGAAAACEAGAAGGMD
jgi:hypothetical protein